LATLSIQPITLHMNGTCTLIWYSKVLFGTENKLVWIGCKNKGGVREEIRNKKDGGEGEWNMRTAGNQNHQCAEI
jgi:hypothetical protein